MSGVIEALETWGKIQKDKDHYPHLLEFGSSVYSKDQSVTDTRSFGRWWKLTEVGPVCVCVGGGAYAFVGVCVW